MVSLASLSYADSGGSKIAKGTALMQNERLNKSGAGGHQLEIDSMRKLS